MEHEHILRWIQSPAGAQCSHTLFSYRVAGRTWEHGVVNFVVLPSLADGRVPSLEHRASSAWERKEADFAAETKRIVLTWHSTCLTSTSTHPQQYGTSFTGVRPASGETHSRWPRLRPGSPVSCAWYSLVRRRFRYWPAALKLSRILSTRKDREVYGGREASSGKALNKITYLPILPSPVLVLVVTG